MSDLNVALILKLVDQVTGPIKPVLASLDKVRSQSEAWTKQSQAALAAHRSALQGHAVGVVASGAALGAALKPAIDFESAMADVNKVLGDMDPQNVNALQRDILDLSTQLPLAAGGIAAIIEAGAQAGVVDKDLPDAQERAAYLDFARDAAQMAVAFGISADAAGGYFAAWRSSLGLSADEARDLGDAANYLSNSMNATAPDIAEVMMRQGALAMSAGLTAEEVAALSAALLTSGQAPEVVATAIKNMTNALTQGAEVTRAQKTAFEAIGLDPVATAKRMQQDAGAVIKEVMGRLAELPDYQRNSILGKLVGEEAKGAVAPLMTNINLLGDALAKVENRSDREGSMLGEYNTRLETTANNLQLLMNHMQALSIVAGTILLPALNDLLDTIAPMVRQFTAFAEAHPEIISGAFKAAAGLVALKGAVVLAGLAFTSLAGPVLWAIRLVTALPSAVGMAGAALTWLALSPLKLVAGALRLIAGLFRKNPIVATLMSIIYVGDAIYSNWGKICTYLSERWQMVKDAFGEGFWNGIWELIKQIGAALINGIVGFIEHLTGWDINGIITGWIAAITGADWFQTGVEIVSKIGDGFNSLIASLGDGLKAMLEGLVPDWVRDLQEWAAPEASPAAAHMPATPASHYSQNFGPGGAGRIAQLNARPVAPILSAAAPQNPSHKTAPASVKHITDARQVTVNVHPSAGMNTRDLAHETARAIDGGALHDGADDD